ncbi:RNA polymerase sigma factor (sigma-70 family) [Nocardia transvalensis]|uniref:RNA polymerase sigma factor (Sigma-70 family) n=1 Tax=Nocardia transvalensis TaxID=37333 RepID=A0A7W9UKX8_9NOCA|nr:sigma-70 family RNA polymerase sigma factor [Nocardia transvalensis]MBB5916787.1 RNA polymerase sigma factor (sigma-70 family) [Nocardia transvalensis]
MGPHTGFDNLFKMHAGPVYRYAFKALRDEHLAKDVVQQVFLAVWNQFDADFARASSAVARRLIQTIAARRVIDVWRGLSRDPVPVSRYIDSDVPLFGGGTETGDPLTRLLGDQELKNFLYVLVMSLSDTEYQIVLMAWLLGLPDTEIAEIMNKTVGTVRSHKSRARKKIDTMVRTSRHRFDYDIDYDVAGFVGGGELWA